MPACNIPQNDVAKHIAGRKVRSIQRHGFFFGLFGTRITSSVRKEERREKKL
jgi:hypothetical protein